MLVHRSIISASEHLLCKLSSSYYENARFLGRSVATKRSRPIRIVDSSLAIILLQAKAGPKRNVFY